MTECARPLPLASIDVPERSPSRGGVGSLSLSMRLLAPYSEGLTGAATHPLVCPSGWHGERRAGKNYLAGLDRLGQAVESEMPLQRLVVVGEGVKSVVDKYGRYRERFGTASRSRVQLALRSRSSRPAAPASPGRSSIGT